jgi:UDP-glucose 4-epimerase
VINVATGRRITLNRLLAALNRLTGRKLRARHLPPRAGDVKHSLADVTRARQQLGYRPIVDFETGLAQTVEWYRR